MKGISKVITNNVEVKILDKDIWNRFIAFLSYPIISKGKKEDFKFDYYDFLILLGNLSLSKERESNGLFFYKDVASHLYLEYLVHEGLKRQKNKQTKEDWI